MKNIEYKKHRIDEDLIALNEHEDDIASQLHDLWGYDYPASKVVYFLERCKQYWMIRALGEEAAKNDGVLGDFVVRGLAGSILTILKECPDYKNELQRVLGIVDE